MRYINLHFTLLYFTLLYIFAAKARIDNSSIRFARRDETRQFGGVGRREGGTREKEATYAAVGAGATEQSRSQLGQRVDVAGVRLRRPDDQSVVQRVLLHDAAVPVADVERRLVDRHAQARRHARLRRHRHTTDVRLRPRLRPC